MKKYIIEKMDVMSRPIENSTEVNLKLVSVGTRVSVEDARVLRRAIEEIEGEPEWCKAGVGFTVPIGGRSNGKRAAETWPRTFAEAIMRSEIEDKERKKLEIKRVVLHNPATIVFWADGTKTVVKCQDGDEFIPETGIAMCFMKKALGNKSNFNNAFKKHIPEMTNVEIAKAMDMPDTKVKSKKTYKHLDSQLIYRVLRENKMTVPELAKRVGVSTSSVYTWLRGGGIQKRTLNKMSKVLHILEEDLVNG